MGNDFLANIAYVCSGNIPADNGEIQRLVKPFGVRMIYKIGCFTCYLFGVLTILNDVALLKVKDFGYTAVLRQ